MKKTISILSLLFVASLFAAPSVTVNSVSQDAKRTVTVTYTLSGEPAVVTMGSVTTNGAAMAEKDLYVVTGDANRLLQTGSHTLKWQPPVAAGFGPFDSGNVTVALKAWATNAPPDYMVIDLDTKRVRYYTSAAAVPGGVTDLRYKTDHLVMRRIPAAGVKWRMGSPMDEVGRMTSDTTSWTYRSSENTHYVELSEDYYLGIYPVTYRQEYWLKGGSTSDLRDAFSRYSSGSYAEGTLSGILSEDDWPVGCQQWAVLRNWGHRSKKGCPYYTSQEGDSQYKFWPRDGHELSPKTFECCATCEGKAGVMKTATLAWFRETMGLKFDLPTDAQWDFAARGGKTEYAAYYNGYTPTGDFNQDAAGIDEIGWFCANSTNRFFTSAVVCPNRKRTLVNGATTTPHGVGQKQPNGFGLYDMLGNISEFVLDAYTTGCLPNNTTVKVDPPGFLNVSANTFDLMRLERGGSFDAKPVNMRIVSNTAASLGTTYADSPVIFNNGTSADQKAKGFPTRTNGFRLWLPCHAAK